MASLKMLKRALCKNIATSGARFVGIIGPLTIPPLQIATLYYFWQDYSRVVDKRYCSCSCWDTVFKGSYESGIAPYKHMYFNATTNMLKIWVLIVIGVIAFYETMKHLAKLAIKQRLRQSMMLLFSSALFSNYYSWWVYINYWNDDFYSQWYHQLFFTITELLSTCWVVYLADKKNPITHRKAFGIAAIALLHIVAGGWDQFFENVIRGEGHAHQVIRDLGFMIPDILHVVVPLWLIKRESIYNIHLPNSLAYMSSIVLIGLCIWSFLL
ncbi:PREDICTED: uncharacterized protein LOC105566859 [Vollenhovia emeryi]|uniref:uncharacterized protein LOC105566859 n=1 Tax=Vollenhovia emeryi TaxID=411798 RepID=UPI0005F50C4D|nr:PREDICTED: uncharacterized protein LOC105566859 [Vollenhovia emeryi]XP_011876616.1 PREDICTED: uncharacterized protein LOC105566859 [Vollenhovia emeryi]